MPVIKGTVSLQREFTEVFQEFPKISVGETNIFMTPGLLYKSEISNNTTFPNTHLDIATGYCASSNNEKLIKCESWTIDISSPWASGNNNGKLVDAESIEPFTTYHIFAITNNTGTIFDYCVSPQLEPTLPESFKYYRRIGSRQTNSLGNLIIIHQTGDWHRYDEVQIPLDGVFISTDGALYDIGTPTGIITEARIIVSPGSPINTGGSNSLAISVESGDSQNPTSPQGVPMNSGFRGVAGAHHYYIGGAVAWYGTAAEIVRSTNTQSSLYMRKSGQPYLSSNSATTIQVVGYYDTRGRI